MKSSYASIVKFVIRFLYLQLFLSLISLPILIYWGIPFSLQTFLGNLIFSPILTLFLLLSSIIFFCQLLYLPCGFFIVMLNWLTTVWLWFMRRCAGSFFIGFATPGPVILVLLVVSVMAVIHARSIKKPWQSIGALLIIACLFYGISHWLSADSDQKIITASYGQVVIAKKGKEVVLIDQGCIGRLLALDSFFEYTLLPELIKMTGAAHIDHCIIGSNSPRVMTSLTTQMRHVHIAHLYLPCWRGTVPAPHYWGYKKLRKEAQDRECSLLMVGEDPVIINRYYTIMPTGYGKKNGYEVAQFEVDGFTGDNLASKL